MVSSVLVIDNDIALTEILKATLEPKEFSVHTAHEVEEGINAAHRLNPDVIVLDLYLPEKDGSKVCRDIREFSNTPILILSVFNNPEAIAQALDEGADDYLIKPVPSGVLIAHLKKLIRRGRTEQITINSQNDL
ncbi:MAG TPA: response regulator [Anaerolineales bacterium]|nr:response regulator [Anaerolineales bacterium]HUV26596.1 response regulator [Anaerolineales bacterium]